MSDTGPPGDSEYTEQPGDAGLWARFLAAPTWVKVLIPVAIVALALFIGVWIGQSGSDTSSEEELLQDIADELADDEFEEIITELDITPRLLHPTGKFRNIRRFAFVVHPLSQEFIKKGFPIPKATPKMVMDKVEQLAAYIPPQVYCKMENIGKERPEILKGGADGKGNSSPPVKT